MKQQQTKITATVNKRVIFGLLLMFFYFSVHHCRSNPPDEKDCKITSTNLSNRTLLVVGSDYQSGSFSTINLADYSVQKNKFAVHQDSVIREIDGVPYILERQGGDNIKRLDKNNNFCIVYEQSLKRSPEESVNPHDIAKIDANTALISAYNLKELRVVNLTDGQLTDTTLDISSYSSDSSSPNLSQLLRVDNFIYATLHDLVGTSFVPTNSRLLQIDVSDSTDLMVVHAPLLTPFKNISEKLQLYTSGGVRRILGAAVGAYGVNDGGVISFNLNTNFFETPTFAEEVVSETTGTQGKDITQVVYLNETRAFALLTDKRFKNFVVEFDPSTRIITSQLLPLNDATDGADYAGELLLQRNRLFIGDRNIMRPGIRVFNTDTSEEITTSPLDVDLPPYSMLLLEPSINIQNQ